MIQLGNLKLKTRITSAAIRRTRLEGGIDLGGQTLETLQSFMFDPIVVTEACFHLYKPQIEAAGLDEDAFFEICGSEEVEQLREEVVRQMRSFSYSWMIVSTEMEDLRSGRQGNLLQKVMESELQTPKAPTGLSS